MNDMPYRANDMPHRGIMWNKVGYNCTSELFD